VTKEAFSPESDNRHDAEILLQAVTAKFIFGQDHNTHLNLSSVDSFTGALR